MRVANCRWDMLLRDGRGKTQWRTSDCFVNEVCLSPVWVNFIAGSPFTFGRFEAVDCEEVDICSDVCDKCFAESGDGVRNCLRVVNDSKYVAACRGSRSNPEKANADFVSATPRDRYIWEDVVVVPPIGGVACSREVGEQELYDVRLVYSGD